MAEGADHFAATLAAYRAEVLRWNRRINLISRQQPAGRLDALIDQCDRALTALLGAYPELCRGPLLYCDLGAGAGLPGFVWHERLIRQDAGTESWLVEPRDKRAWFLERVARLGGSPAYGVLCGRWGDVAASPATLRDTALVSLKALRLKDPAVLAGMAALRQGSGSLPGRVVIARFHPPDEVWSPDLAAALGWGAAGGATGPWRGDSAAVLPVVGPQGADVALVVCTYVRDVA
ncbi:MAG: RsmG family class I SAM-dependent methyltransferase [Candidatus Krumholzibacteriia bacterium]